MVELEQKLQPGGFTNEESAHSNRGVIRPRQRVHCDRSQPLALLGLVSEQRERAAQHHVQHSSSFAAPVAYLDIRRRRYHEKHSRSRRSNSRLSK